jgi:lipopolysaccharide biosynthesis protein
MPPKSDLGVAGAGGRSKVEDDPIARVVAFYLPQYHPIPENDRWWGEGFTDWTNVRRARPLFEGHDQPKIPTTLGYYDLRDVDRHHAQAALARANGVAGFCYYAYWFGGRRLLERPLDLVASNPDLAMPYAICWANEPWSRRWDGSESEILMEQRHSPERDAAFIEDHATHLADPRYLRVGGRPLLLIYRAELLADPRRTTDMLRERAMRLGLGDLFLGMVQSFGSWDPIGYGCDAAVEFPPHPHNLGLDARATAYRTPRNHAESRVWAPAYEDLIRVMLSRPVPQFTWFRTVMPGWDNTPRRGRRGIVYVGATPAVFRQWLEEVLRGTYLFGRPGERLVFINGWNEWAEGAYLEPDASHGDAFLRAVRAALEATDAFAHDTARLLEAGPRKGGLLEDARLAWTGRSARSRFMPPALGPDEEGADLDLDDARAIKVTLWALGKVRAIPPLYIALRNAARLLRNIRRRWAKR